MFSKRPTGLKVPKTYPKCYPSVYGSYQMVACQNSCLTLTVLDDGLSFVLFDYIVVDKDLNMICILAYRIYVTGACVLRPRHEFCSDWVSNFSGRAVSYVLSNKYRSDTYQSNVSKIHLCVELLEPHVKWAWEPKCIISTPDLKCGLLIWNLSFFSFGCYVVQPVNLSVLWAPSQYKDRLIYVWWFPC